MTSAEWSELIVAWLPLVILLGAWAYYMRFANRHYKAHVAEVNETNAAILAANREMLTELRAIRTALECREP